MAKITFTIESVYLSVTIATIDNEIIQEDYPAGINPTDAVLELMDQCGLDPEQVRYYTTRLIKTYIKRKKINYGNY